MCCGAVARCASYVKLYVHSLVDKLKRFYENARFYNKIHSPSSVCTFAPSPIKLFTTRFSPLLNSGVTDVLVVFFSASRQMSGY